MRSPCLSFETGRFRVGDLTQPLLDRFLQKIRGSDYVLADETPFQVLEQEGYADHDPLGERPGVVHVGCSAHARRKFDEALKYLEGRWPKLMHVLDDGRIALPSATTSAQIEALMPSNVVLDDSLTRIAKP